MTTQSSLKSLSLTNNVKIAQLRRNESVNTRGAKVLGSQVQSPLEVNILLKQESIPVGCVPSAAVAVKGGDVCPGGPPGGSVCLPKGVYHVTCDACWDTPPSVNRITDRCKNITFPQLRLREV